MKALLDTHVLFWWFSAGRQLSPAHREIIARADGENPLWVSEISLWEIAMLHQLGRLELRLPLRDWLEKATAPPLVRRVGLSPAVAAEVAVLPDELPRDPADRIIVATARVLGLTLLTRDAKILKAKAVQTVT